MQKKHLKNTKQLKKYIKQILPIIFNAEFVNGKLCLNGQKFCIYVGERLN